METNEKIEMMNEISSSMKNTRDLMIDFIKKYGREDCEIVINDFYDEPVYTVVGIKQVGNDCLICTNNEYDGYEENRIELLTANELYQIAKGLFHSEIN